MKKFIMAVLFVLAMAIPASADIAIEWGYTPPTIPAISGYNLYKNGVKVDTFQGASTMGGVSKVSVTKGDLMTITAAFVDGSESPHSSSYTITWTGNAPTIIRIKYISPNAN